MSDSYTIYLKRSVHQALRELRGNRKRAIEKYIDYLSDNPFDVGDFSETDSNGRTVHCKVIRDFALSFYPDHAVKELKVIELVRTP